MNDAIALSGWPADAPVKLHVDDAIAFITLDRPAAYNAIDSAMTRALALAMDRIEALPDLRVIVLRGAGKGFCAGGDLGFFASRGDGLREAVDEVLSHGHRFLQALQESAKLVLVSVHGSAAGAGLSLVLAGDFCIAAQEAFFVPAYRKLGVSPDMGGTASAVRALGLRQAMRMHFLEERMSAAEAQRLGIVSRIVAADRLEEATLQLARELAALPEPAAAGTKRLLRGAVEAPLAAQLEAERLSFQAAVHAPATQAALQRFVGRPQ